MFQTEGSRKCYISQNVINRIERVLLEFMTWIKGLRLVKVVAVVIVFLSIRIYDLNKGITTFFNFNWYRLKKPIIRIYDLNKVITTFSNRISTFQPIRKIRIYDLNKGITTYLSYLKNILFYSYIRIYDLNKGITTNPPPLFIITPFMDQLEFMTWIKGLRPSLGETQETWNKFH